MSYLGVARKYRPQRFDEIVGQPHITTTLSNALMQGRVAHAYLFAGPRGVGKTTTARILAKALDCEKGPTVEFCNSCPSCTEISQGMSLDVLEIDGASNRGIEEIRGLRDNVKFAPSKGKFKIYIIDEVHMLTPEAFNALLKTLEEPPPHVKFIFATTQAHKVPATILSRCQRFDFRRIGSRLIFESLKKIAAEEKFDSNDDVLALIAKYADGSMRDGQVILDQVTSFAGGRVSVEDVSRMLGMADEEVLFGLSGSIKERDAVKAINLIARLVDEGKDIGQAILDLIEHFRNMAVIKVAKDPAALVDAAPEKMKRYAEEAARFSIEEMLYAVYTLSNALDFIRRSNIPRIPFETAMIKLTRMGPLASLDEILKKVDALANSKQQTADSKQSEEKPRTTNHEPRTTNDEPQTPIPEPRTPIAGTLADILAAWSRIIGTVGKKKMSTALYLREGRPISLEGIVLSIGFPSLSKFHKEALESPDQRKMIEDSVKEVLGLDTRVSIVYDESVQTQEGPALAPAGAEDAVGEPDMEEAPKEEEDPIIKSAKDIFGGEVIRPSR
jgi:DNA polymerase-3 subunit gamma/tau